MWRRWSLLVGSAALSACVGQGIIDDGTSVSFGPPNDGALLNAARLPTSGAGYQMPPTWAKRGLHHGTGELVTLIEHLGRALDRHHLGRPLAVADLDLDGFADPVASFFDSFYAPRKPAKPNKFLKPRRFRSP